MTPKEFLDIVHTCEGLKNVTRHCDTSAGRRESVAEHCWRLSLMAALLRPQFPDLDMDRTVELCLIHDLGELFTGDVPAFEKTDDDRARERALCLYWVDSLPEEVRLRLAALRAEMEAGETAEAKLSRALDRLEALGEGSAAGGFR